MPEVSPTQALEAAAELLDLVENYRSNALAFLIAHPDLNEEAGAIIAVSADVVSAMASQLAKFVATTHRLDEENDRLRTLLDKQ